MLKQRLDNAYSSFASVYDIFMGDVPYSRWVKYIYEIWEMYNCKPNLVCELACGTGNVSSILAKDGYDVIAIDHSPDMLMQAKQKADDNNLDILFLNQDMRSFELYGTVDCFICLFDSINYILDYKEIVKIFKLVNNYLNPTGLFIFDINTEFKYEEKLANNVFTDLTDDTAYIWENYYDTIKKINEYYINFFVKSDNTNYYTRFSETHYQKAFSLDDITCAVNESKLKLCGVFDAFSFNEPREDSERIYFILNKTL